MKKLVSLLLAVMMVLAMGSAMTATADQPGLVAVRYGGSARRPGGGRGGDERAVSGGTGHHLHVCVYDG